MRHLTNENFSSASNSTANVLQIEISEKNLNVDLLIKEIAENTKFLKLKSFKIDNEISQYIFWFELEKSNFGKFLAYTQKLSKVNKDISIDVYSRSGIYE